MTTPRLTPIALALRRAALASLLAPAAASGGPSGAEIVHGQVNLTSPDPGALVIDQQSDAAIINWQSFSIGANEYVVFNQPSASAAVLASPSHQVRRAEGGSSTADHRPRRGPSAVRCATDCAHRRGLRHVATAISSDKTTGVGAPPQRAAGQPRYGSSGSLQLLPFDAHQERGPKGAETPVHPLVATDRPEPVHPGASCSAEQQADADQCRRQATHP